MNSRVVNIKYRSNHTKANLTLSTRQLDAYWCLKDTLQHMNSSITLPITSVEEVVLILHELILDYPQLGAFFDYSRGISTSSINAVGDYKQRVYSLNYKYSKHKTQKILKKIEEKSLKIISALPLYSRDDVKITDALGKHLITCYSFCNSRSSEAKTSVNSLEGILAHKITNTTATYIFHYICELMDIHTVLKCTLHNEIPSISCLMWIHGNVYQVELHLDKKKYSLIPVSDPFAWKMH